MARLPSTTSLQCFSISARTGSFTAAASQLNLTQGAVSRQILGLEERLGVELFKRRSKGIDLTEAGHAYLEEVEPALRQLESSTVNLRISRGGGAELHLSVSSSFANYWLIPRLPEFTQAFPDIILNLSTRVGPVPSLASLNATIEFGLDHRAGMISTVVLPLILRPYASPQWLSQRPDKADKEALIAQLRAEDLIHHATVPQAWTQWLSGWPHEPEASDDFETNPSLRVLNAGSYQGRAPSMQRYELMSMASNAAVAGLGVCLLPKFMVANALRARRLVELSSRSWRAKKAYYLRVAAPPIEHRAVDRFSNWLQAQSVASKRL